jgi:hypothetical protein
MKTWKTGLPLCLLLALLLGLWGATPAQAADSGFVIENGVLTAYNGPGGSVTVPSGVTSIERDVFLERDDITGITIPYGVTTIGERAFGGCTNMTWVSLPGTLTEIVDGAFERCTSLERITIPYGVTRIGIAAFAACGNLTTVDLPATLTEIDSSAFYDCSSLKNITLPYGLTTIGGSAFGFCSSLNVAIPSTVTSIGTEAFTNCHSLTSVVIPAGVTEIGDQAFHSCTGLTQLSLPATLTSIDRDAFSECESLRQVDLPSGVTFIGAYAFRGTPWQASLGEFAVANGFLLKYQGTASDVTIPSGVKFVVGGAFDYNKTLTRVTVPAGVTFIGEVAFSGCSNLTQATLPDGLVTIDKWAFNDCTALRSVNFPQGLTTIGQGAFSGCSALEPVVFPSTLTTLDQAAFGNCTALKSVVLPSGMKTIEYEAFGGCTQLSDVTVPDTVTFIGEGAFRDTVWLKQQEEAGVEFILGGRVLIEYNGKGGNVTIPSNVWRIAYGAFSGHTDVTAVTIPVGVFAIDKNAFSNCTGLVSATIPEGVTEIGGYAFTGCSMSELDLPSTLQTIGNRAFSFCNGLTSVTLPEGLTYLGYESFRECMNLRKVQLPTTLTFIGDGSFFNIGHYTSIFWLPSLAEYSNVTPYVYTNSYAEQWAKDYGYKFVSVGTMVPTFNDVPADSYCYAAVNWAIEQELTTGTHYGTFSPDMTCSTGQILTFLYRSSGSPFVRADNPFTDVTSSDYYYKAALWARDMGMASGTTLNPDQPCTRASTVWYMWKAAGSPAVSTPASFSDVPASSDYATAVAWAVEKGVTSGTGNNCFSPDAICSRGQIVTFLHRAFQNQALSPARNIYQRVVPDNFTAILRDNGVVLTRNDGLPDVDYVITVAGDGTVTVQEVAGIVYSENTYDGCILTDTKGNVIFTTEK